MITLGYRRELCVAAALALLVAGCDLDGEAVAPDDAADPTTIADLSGMVGPPADFANMPARDMTNGKPADLAPPPLTNCKRGLAVNVVPGAAFVPAVAWYYDWSLMRAGGANGVEFVPMVWSSSTVGNPLPAGTRFLLAFNEPNFHVQANLTPQQAASFWPMLQTQAAGIPLVSPALNFCGPAADCNGTNPYQYFKDFFASCPNCRVDYLAVHWYNCDLPSLRDYLEPGGNLEGFEKFNKPIWLTEFSCNNGASVADQEAYMRAAIPYLESNPKVYRYSWFSADPIPSSKLVNDDGSPTALGKVYISLPQNCK